LAWCICLFTVATSLTFEPVSSVSCAVTIILSSQAVLFVV
jgi:hypothetical protein